MSEHPIIQYLRLTLVPCLARLFGKRRRLSSLCLFLTLCICALLLSALCLTLGQNLASLDTLTAAFDKYITAHGVTTRNQPFRESVRTVLTYAEAEIYVTHVCFILLWLATSLAAVYRVFSEAVATEKYVYALYIIYGADTKLLKKSIMREFWVLGLPALILSLPPGLLLCRDTSAAGGLSLLVILEMLVLFFVLSLLCARRVTKRLFKESCVELMTAIDTSEYIESPRRVSLKRALRKRSGWGYAVLSFGRMRKYRLTHALTVALIGAVLFSMTALTLPDNYATGDSTHEYTLTFESGVSFRSLEEDYLPAIESLEAVVYTSSRATDTADRIGTHLMLRPNQVSDAESADLLQQEDKWALDTVKIICGDGATETELGEKSAVIPEKFQGRPMTPLGYTVDTVKAGEAVYVYPEQNGEPTIKVGDTVEVAIPDGVEGYERYGDHITVKITSRVAVGWVYTAQTFNYPVVEKVCPRIYEDYLILNPADYGTVTGTVQTDPVSVTETYAEELEMAEGQCYLLLPETLKKAYGSLSHVTVITPPTTVKKAFESISLLDGKMTTLPTDTYFINETSRYAGIYLGRAEEYAASAEAVGVMTERMDTVLDKKAGETPLATQYRIAGRTYVADLSAPCVIFPNGEQVSFTSMATELSAMTLTDSGCGDEGLYFMDTETAVLTAGDDTAYRKGTRLQLTTDIPNDFADAIKEAHMSLVCGRGSYQLTQGSISAVFKNGKRTYLLFDLDASSNLSLDEYPVVIVGEGSYLPVGEATADSIRTLSDLDSMLVFQGDPKEERENAILLQGDIATNILTVTTEREAGLAESLEASEAILRLPEAHPYALAAGDAIHVAVSQPLTLDMTEVGQTKLDLLACRLERLNHSYLSLTLAAVEIDAALTSPVLILSEDTFSSVCGRSGVIPELHVYVNSHASTEALGEVSVTLHGLTAEGISLHTNNTVLRSQGTGSQRYPAILQAMLPPLCLLILLLTLSSARTLYLRREKERSAYVAAGEHGRMRFQMALGEGLLSCLWGGGLYALLCPVFILLLKLFCGRFHVPLKPESFSLTAFFVILGLILASSLGASLLSLIRPVQPAKANKGGPAL